MKLKKTGQTSRKVNCSQSRRGRDGYRAQRIKLSRPENRPIRRHGVVGTGLGLQCGILTPSTKESVHRLIGTGSLIRSSVYPKKYRLGFPKCSKWVRNSPHVETDIVSWLFYITSIWAFAAPAVYDKTHSVVAPVRSANSTVSTISRL